ncbi:hypothetical protein PR048_013883 [Dryococelus australis]|uniref:Uncharacterized protein n=1 Tax=Dryococelus australis TaxID=614101 RepID=A0ABQ9HU94_9NEOP|nr:hypothetical protein PR048_013883 [Dryococelus australis]
MIQRQLQECAAKLDQQIDKIRHILNISSFRTVSAVWNGYSVLFGNFLQAKEDMRKSSRDRNTYNELLKHLSSIEKQKLRVLEAQVDINGGKFCFCPLTNNAKLHCQQLKATVTNDNFKPRKKPGIQKIITQLSAECKHRFSQMNLIVSPTRTRLLTSYVSVLMFLKLDGSSLSE